MIHAASHLLKVATTVITTATFNASPPVNRLRTQSEEQGAKKSTEQILIPVANPDTIEDLINLALVIKDAKQKNGLIALNVINDSNSSEKKELQGKRNLEKAAPGFIFRLWRYGNIYPAQGINRHQKLSDHHLAMCTFT